MPLLVRSMYLLGQSDRYFLQLLAYLFVKAEESLVFRVPSNLFSSKQEPLKHSVSHYVCSLYLWNMRLIKSIFSASGRSPLLGTACLYSSYMTTENSRKHFIEGRSSQESGASFTLLNVSLSRVLPPKLEFCQCL